MSVREGVSWRMGNGTEGRTHPLDYACSYARDMSLNDLVPRCAEHQGAPLVDWRKQRIAVFEAVLQVGEGLVKLVDEPVEFASLWWRKDRFYQHPGCINFGHLRDNARAGRDLVNVPQLSR